MSVQKKNLKIAKIIYLSVTLIQLLAGQGMASPSNEKDFFGDELSSSAHHKQKEETLDPEYNLIGVALFSGKDIFSKCIKKVTLSKTSHVGIILADAKGEWYCFESTGSKDEVLEGNHPHVRSTLWSNVVKEYPGHISYRKLEGLDKNEINSSRITQFVNNHIDKPYTENPIKLIKALFRINSDSKKLRTFFCSQLVAELLMELGILKETVPTNSLPKDFEKESKFLKLRKGFKLTSASFVK